MPTFGYGTAKGLSESCSPNRSDYCFGAALADFDADDWNCIPTLWDAETVFDLSTITFNHEVVVARAYIDNTSEGYTCINMKWYSDSKLLYESDYCYNCSSGGWMYAYAYIGWVAGKITENGDYHVDITITGANSDTHTLYFSVVGIPAGGMPY